MLMSEVKTIKSHKRKCLDDLQTHENISYESCERNLIYNYSYGDEYLLGACIKIYKHLNHNDVYTIEACFEAFNEIIFPIIKSSYVIIEYKESFGIDEINLNLKMIIKKINITILAHSNPPPEKLFIIE